MKKKLFCLFVFLTLLLAGCTLAAPSQGGAAPATATPDAQVQTELAQMITTLPADDAAPPAEDAVETPTAPPGEAEVPAVDQAATATPEEANPAPESASSTPEAPTPTLEAPTATPELPATPTQTPVAVLPTTTPTISPTVNPSFTPAPGDPHTRLGPPASADPMNNAQTWLWPTDKDQFTSNEFKDGYMVITALSETDGWRMANPLDRQFANLYIEADMRTQTCEGTDHYGIIFRVPELHKPNQGYLFGLTCDGRYSLRRWNGLAGLKGEMEDLKPWTTSSAIIPGSNQGNRLGVFAVGKRVFLYINGQLLTEVQDDTFEKGYFGVFVGSDKTENLTILVDNMSYWENPNP